MSEYILNKTPVRTTSHFNINDLKLQLNLPKSFNNDDFVINGDTSSLTIKCNKKAKKFISKIGIELKDNYELTIIVPENTTISEPILFTYYFKEDENLVDTININYLENSSAKFIFKYISSTSGKNFHHLKQITTMRENSVGSVSVLNLLNDSSTSFMAFENMNYENSVIDYNIVDLGGAIKVTNLYGELLQYNSQSNINTIYAGNNTDIIDMNYYVKNIGRSSQNNMIFQGALDNKARKNFKGTIDFVKGSEESIGKESENCILLSTNCSSKSLPMLLCHEENVFGEHGVSSGKVDEGELFYLMSRGLSKRDAEKLIIKGNFTNIVKNIPIKKIQEEIFELLDKKLDV